MKLNSWCYNNEADADAKADQLQNSADDYHVIGKFYQLTSTDEGCCSGGNSTIRYMAPSDKPCTANRTYSIPSIPENLNGGYWDNNIEAIRGAKWDATTDVVQLDCDKVSVYTGQNYSGFCTTALFNHTTNVYYTSSQTGNSQGVPLPDTCRDVVSSIKIGKR